MKYLILLFPLLLSAESKYYDSISKIGFNYPEYLEQKATSDEVSLIVADKNGYPNLNVIRFSSEYSLDTNIKQQEQKLIADYEALNMHPKITSSELNDKFFMAELQNGEVNNLVYIIPSCQMHLIITVSDLAKSETKIPQIASSIKNSLISPTCNLDKAENENNRNFIYLISTFLIITLVMIIKKTRLKTKNN